MSSINNVLSSQDIDSSAPGQRDSNLKGMIFKLIVQNSSWGIRH